MVAQLRCKHNVDVKLCKMPSIHKTPSFDREILLGFDITVLQQLIFFHASRRNIAEI